MYGNIDSMNVLFNIQNFNNINVQNIVGLMLILIIIMTFTCRIDYIFCNRVDEVESSGVITTNISDHYPVFAREKFPTQPEESISINYIFFG